MKKKRLMPAHPRTCVASHLLSIEGFCLVQTKIVEIIIVVIFSLSILGCGSSSASSENSVLEIGKIEIYSDSDHKTYRTSNDELYDRSLLTAAHKNLSYGTYLKVTNLANGYRTVVKINDHNLNSEYSIKVSHEAAKQLGLSGGVPDGTTVSLEITSGK